MKKLVAALLCLAGTTVLADDVRRSVDASAKGFVTISNTAGSVEVEGWSRDEVDVEADLGSGVEELVVERDDDEVRVVVRSRRNSNRSSSDLVVKVPENSTVKVGGVSIDITVANVYGAQRLQTVSGDIETEAYGADIELQTVSGDIEVVGDRRDMRAALSTVSGDIDASSLRGGIEAGTVSGDVVIVDGEFDRAQMSTTSGDIVFKAALRDAARLDANTINGDVDIDLAGRVSARFDIETFNGDIRNCFGPEPARTSRHAPGRELSFTEGGGSGLVTISTLNGDLRLCKE